MMNIDSLDLLPSSITSELQRQITSFMDASAMFYRIFVRMKSKDSAKSKIEKKGYDETKKMQDLFGVRIVLYFKDDITICRKLLEREFQVVDISEDVEKETVFAPTRLNYVCKLPLQIKSQIMSDFWERVPIDDTFEIQIRTIFSEGWHEVEHDLRYKCKEDWENENEMSRALNGIFATLETCDWSILSLFDKLAYKNYQSQKWEAMLRNKFRIRIKGDKINESIRKVFENDKNIIKRFFRIDREEFVFQLSSRKISSIPKTIDNIVYIANNMFVHNEELDSITPKIIKNKLS